MMNTLDTHNILNECKSLMEYKLYSKEYWREYRSKNQDKLRAYTRERYKRQYPQKKEQELARRKKWASNNKEKVSCHHKVQSAVIYGRLIKQPCEVCGELKVHAHHEDYSKPLEVNWLCALHHAHRRMALKYMNEEMKKEIDSFPEHV